jgi:hypothetical protein
MPEIALLTPWGDDSGSKLIEWQLDVAVGRPPG